MSHNHTSPNTCTSNDEPQYAGSAPFTMLISLILEKRKVQWQIKKLHFQFEQTMWFGSPRSQNVNVVQWTALTWLWRYEWHFSGWFCVCVCTRCTCSFAELQVTITSPPWWWKLKMEVQRNWSLYVCPPASVWTGHMQSTIKLQVVCQESVQSNSSSQ